MKNYILFIGIAAAAVWWYAGGGSGGGGSARESGNIQAQPAAMKTKASAKSGTASPPSAFASVSEAYSAKFTEDDTASALPGGRNPAAIAGASARILTMVDNSISRITQRNDRERLGVREAMRTHGVPDKLIEELFQREQQAAKALSALEKQEKRMTSAEFAAREDELYHKHTEWIYSNISRYFVE